MLKNVLTRADIFILFFKDFTQIIMYYKHSQIQINVSESM